MLEKLEKYHNELKDLYWKNGDEKEINKAIKDLEDLLEYTKQLEIKNSKKSSFYYFIQNNLIDEIISEINRKIDFLNYDINYSDEIEIDMTYLDEL